MSQFGGPRLVKRVTLGDEGKQKMIEGIAVLADAVGATLGASGRTVVIEDDFGNPHVTKDGVTVAESIMLENPIKNLACTMVKQAAKNTANKAGDGTTTSVVLTQAIIEEYFKLEGDKHSFRDIKTGVEKMRDYVADQLTERSVEVDDERLIHVSTISANNDTNLGGLIAEAFRSAGDNGIVTFEGSGSSETFIDIVEGTKIPAAVKSPHFNTNQEKEICELDKPLIFLSTSDIPNVRKIQDILEHAIKSNRALLLIAPLESQPLAALAMNKVKGNIKVSVIDPPSFGLKRKDILEDLALLVGGKVFDESLGDSLDAITPDMLGSADKAISDSDGTVLVIQEKPQEALDKIETLKETLDKEEDHHILSRHLNDRLALLSGGVSIIKVGAETDVELKEKLDRVDDAVHAVKAAKKEGILPGGGAALLHLAANNKAELKGAGELTGWNILKEAMFSPFNKILTNAGLDPTDYNIKEWGEGVDVMDGLVKDMYECGIIDPTMVTKTALANAVSVAITILSTDAIISNIRE